MQSMGKPLQTGEIKSVKKICHSKEELLLSVSKKHTKDRSQLMMIWSLLLTESPWCNSTNLII